MKKGIYIMSLGVLGSVLLMGCVNPFTKDGGPDTVLNDLDMGIAIVEKEGMGSVAETANEAGVVNVASEAPLSRYGNNLKCSQLKNLESQKFCEMQMMDIIGSMLESEIINIYDVARCKELPAGVAEDCQSRLEESGVKGPVPADELALFREILRGTVTEPPIGEDGPGGYLQVYDLGKCAQLKTTGYQAYCEKQVAERIERLLFDEIINSGDATRCEELKAPDNLETCKLFLRTE